MPRTDPPTKLIIGLTVNMNPAISAATAYRVSPSRGPVVFESVGSAHAFGERFEDPAAAVNPTGRNSIPRRRRGVNACSSNGLYTKITNGARHAIPIDATIIRCRFGRRPVLDRAVENIDQGGHGLAEYRGADLRAVEAWSRCRRR